MKLKRLWNDRRGSGLISGVGVAFLLLLLSCSVMEYSRLQSTAQHVRDALQAATVETCEEQYADLYPGVREGYSGGYKLTGVGWTENLSAADIYSRMDASLGTGSSGGVHVKSAGRDVDFRLLGLQAKITNAPFAPNDEAKKQLSCSAEIDLEVPMLLHGDGIPAMHTHLTVQGGYTPKF